MSGELMLAASCHSTVRAAERVRATLYRAKLVATDEAGNCSAARSVRFRIPRR